MNELLSKVSSYHLFNYLLPGCLFAAAADRLLHLRMSQQNIVLGLFTYYFYGLVISRLGSLLVEPFLKWTTFVHSEAYADFVAACKQDAKIELLSEVNNTYRTLVSLCLCVATLAPILKFAARFPVLSPVLKTCGAVGTIALMAFAYRKQTAFIRKRVKACAPKTQIIT